MEYTVEGMKAGYVNMHNGYYLVTPGSRVKTICSVHDEDWKTQLIRKYPNIPSDTEITVVAVIQNCYGFYLKVEYMDVIYYINTMLLDYISRSI